MAHTNRRKRSKPYACMHRSARDARGFVGRRKDLASEMVFASSAAITLTAVAKILNAARIL